VLTKLKNISEGVEININKTGDGSQPVISGLVVGYILIRARLSS